MMNQCSDKMPGDMGFHMPGEFEPHEGTFLIWPVRPGSWTHAGQEAKPVFARLAREILEEEELYLLVDAEHREEANEMIGCPGHARLHFLEIETNDAWARDMGPTYVVAANGERRGIHWKFNAWGGDVDGLYADYEADSAAAPKMCEALGDDVFDAGDFVLEGGSIHCDGDGTVVVTEACLLSKGRNPELTKQEIENRLLHYLGQEKVIWLPRGIYNDETNEHVDNAFAFIKPGEAVLAWCDDPLDPQYDMSREDLKVLEQETDAKGRTIRVHKLLIPKEPVRITQEEVDAFAFAEGEDQREAGERLAASYVNFYILNGKVLLPQFGDERDALAVEQLKTLFPERKIVPIDARNIIVGGGNFHCLTQQIPKKG